MNEETKGGNASAELSALADQFERTEQAEAVEGEFEAAPKQPAGPSTGEMLSGLLLLVCNKLIAPRRGKHWALSNGEAEAVGDAAGAVLDKYFPGFHMGPEGALVAVSLAVFAPRLMLDKALQAEEAAKAQAKESET